MTRLLLSLVPGLESSNEDNEIDPEKSIPTEALFLPGVKSILQDNDTVSCALLQNKLGIGYGLATRIVDALIDIGIVVQNTGTHKYEVEKDKIDLLEIYMK